LEYKQHNLKTGKVLKFSWVTDILLSDKNVYKIMRAGRSRWRIENETFNTLKNRGDNFEHNDGHGKKYLCTNFAMLMFLAFGVDQIQQMSCLIFQDARMRARTFYNFCHKVLHCFLSFEVPNWYSLLNYIANPVSIPLPMEWPP